MLYMILDLDGTLCDDRHRQHLAEDGDIDGYHARCFDDEVYKPVLSIVRAWTQVPEQRGIIIITGRPETVREETRAWLRKNNIPYTCLLMRGRKDRRPSREVKGAHVEQLQGSGLPILFAIEDRADLVGVFRDRGISVLQVHHAG